MLTFFRACTILSCCVAGIVLVVGAIMSGSAPQQAAAAAIAAAMAIIPYIFTRMIESVEASEEARKAPRAQE